MSAKEIERRRQEIQHRLEQRLFCAVDDARWLLDQYHADHALASSLAQELADAQERIAALDAENAHLRERAEALCAAEEGMVEAMLDTTRPDA